MSDRFAIVPYEAVIKLHTLSAAAAGLYSTLCLCRNQQTGLCNPSNEQLLEMLEDMPKRTFFSAKQELLKRGWVTHNGKEYTLLIGFRVQKTALLVQKPAQESAENCTPSAEICTDEVQKTALKSAENGTPYIGITDKEQTSGTEREKATLTPGHSPEILALCSLLQSGDPELLSPMGYSSLKALENALKSQRNAAAPEIQEFARRWYAEDWRGKKGQPPTLRQVQDEWAKVMQKRPTATENPPRVRDPDCPKCDKDGWRWRDWPEPTGKMVRCECAKEKQANERTTQNHTRNGTQARP